MNVEHITKLFGSDAGFRSHIWLEGQRLVEAGFQPGDQYTQVWHPDKIICVRGAKETGAAINSDKAYIRKVNRQGTNPAIRLEGKRVQKLFGEKFLSVKATFTDGQIVIEGHEPVYTRSVPEGVQVETEREAA